MSEFKGKMHQILAGALTQTPLGLFTALGWIA